MSVGPDYDGEFRRMMVKNAAAVIPALDSGEEWLMTKIANAAKRYALPESDVIAALRKCEVLRYYFAKDPQKQRMHENAAAAFISAISGIGDFSQLPARGDSAVYATRGEIVSTAQLHRLRRAEPTRTYSKSVDFAWRFGGKQFYACHKHTEETGGAQANQANDARLFLQECAQNNKPECVFVALCDGAFYGGKNGMMGRTKMEGMQAIAAEAKHGNVFAMTTGELPAFLRLKFATADKS